MSPFFATLLHALTRPDGPGGELLSLRRKSHLLQAEWYTNVAKTGEAERKREVLNTNEPTQNQHALIR